MSFQDQYQRKLCTPDEAARMVVNGDNIIAPIACGHPRQILDALARRKEELQEVTFFSTLDLYPSDIWQLGDCDHIQVDSGFVGGRMRQGVHEGIYTYSPVKFADSALAWGTLRDWSIATCVVSPMDKHGYFSMGCSVDYTYSAAKMADKILVEVNRFMPRTHGKCWLHISEIDAIVENHTPLPILPSPPIGEKDKAMGRLIADQVNDGATIQLGLGAIPNAVGMFLADKNDLGVHTEMLTDSIYQLQQAGVVTNRRKTLMKDVSVATFALGSAEMYEWMDDNPAIAMYPVEEVNDPFIVAQVDNMISVNGALSIDLTGQVCAESFGPQQYSNVGGQLDFVQGAWRSRGGKSFVALYSTAKDDTISRIVPQLLPGSYITTPRTETHYVATEYGIALIKAQSVKQRVKNLIAIAHPDHRDWLTFEAKKLGMI